MKYDCPESRDKKKYKRKAMKVTWDDTDDSPSEEEQSQEVTANM